jgi:DNA-binding CsgD family transcriptional regulator
MSDPRGSPAGAGSVLSAVMVGRERELRVVLDALDDVRSERGGAMFVVGEAGIGKSRLAREAVAVARGQGLVVLQGRAVDTSSPTPYRPLAEALCSGVRSYGLPEAPSLAPFRGVLGRLIPEWRAESHARGDESLVDLGEAVLRFLRFISGDRGCLVLLEDLHWADPETLAVVEYLADNLVGEPVLCLATLRDEDRTPALTLVQRLRSRRIGSGLELSRLDATRVEEMVASCLGATDAPSEIVALASVADGVPFLIEEVLAATVASGALVRDRGSWTLSTAVEPVVPLTFADSVRRRLGPLDSGVRGVLCAAAVMGRRFDWSLLPAITDSSEQSVVRALRTAVDAQLLTAEGGEFRFRHALTRDVVFQELLSPEQTALSRRTLDVIESRWPELPEPWCDIAADLAERAHDRERASTLWLEVGRRALDAGALTSAERALMRAQAVAPPGSSRVTEIEECLTDALSLAGKADAAVEVGMSLLEELPKDAFDRRARIALRLGRAMVLASNWKEAQNHVDKARRWAARADDDSLTARLDALGAQVAMGTHRLDDATALATAALARAERVDLADVMCEALEVIGRCARSHDLETAEAAFARAYLIADQRGLTVWAVRALHELGTIDLLDHGGIGRLEAARQLAASVGALATAAVIDVQIAAGLVMRDDVEPALAAARRAADLAGRFRLEAIYGAARGFEATAHARAGRREAMESCIDEALARSGDSPSIRVITTTAAAVEAMREERRADASRYLDEAMTEPPTGDQVPPSSGIRALLRVLDPASSSGPIEEARAGGEPVHFWARAYLEYANAVVHGRAGREQEAMALVAAADQHLARFAWLREYGHRLIAEAAVADNWGDPTTWLREALAFFENRGEAQTASVCRSLLRRAGAPVPRRRKGTEDVPASLRGLGVTGRELEVVRLLAEGLSNKDIAARLYLSPRTVERHIANLTTKAGVDSRAQLVAFAARTLFGGSTVNE